jgi:hypothetical protein
VHPLQLGSPQGKGEPMSNTAAQQRRRRARKRKGITLPTPQPKSRPGRVVLSSYNYGRRKLGKR